MSGDGIRWAGGSSRPRRTASERLRLRRPCSAGGALALDEEAVVLGVVDRCFVFVARERFDCFERVPEGERDELGQLAGVAAQHPGTAVSGRGRVAGDTGVLDVGGVGIGVGVADGASPDPGDHRCLL
jgi:hypothetical protein